MTRNHAMTTPDKRPAMKNIQLELTIDETNLILEARGALPFARVDTLIGRIQEGARKQLDEHAPAPGPNGHSVPNGPSGPNGVDREHAR